MLAGLSVRIVGCESWCLLVVMKKTGHAWMSIFPIVYVDDGWRHEVVWLIEISSTRVLLSV